MKRFNELLTKLKKLNLPENDYAVFGSAPLVIVDMIEDVNDFDIIIKHNSWPFGNKKEVRTKDFEFFYNWPDEDVDDLIDNYSFLYEKVKFIIPKKVIKYKRKLKREKDKSIWNK